LGQSYFCLSWTVPQTLFLLRLVNRH
jgi:hypothetical protein